MDALVRLLQLLVLLLTLPLHLLALLGCWQPLCKMCFPYLMAALTAKCNRKMESKKQQLFIQIKGLAGASGKVSLLELGCGTGANFQFYPAGCRITCLDPNPHFEKLLTKSMAENRHLQYERFVVASGEDMKGLADGCMDVVVSTLVLCSVQSPRRVLQEVHRVLRPVSSVEREWAWGRRQPQGRSGMGTLVCRHVRHPSTATCWSTVNMTGPPRDRIECCGSPQESHLTQQLRGGPGAETPNRVMFTLRSEGLSRMWGSGKNKKGFWIEILEFIESI